MMEITTGILIFVIVLVILANAVDGLTILRNYAVRVRGQLTTFDT